MSLPVPRPVPLPPKQREALEDLPQPAYYNVATSWTSGYMPQMAAEYKSPGQKGQHHPLSCNGTMQFDDEGSLHCPHSMVPEDDPRMNRALDEMLAKLLIETLVQIVDGGSWEEYMNAAWKKTHFQDDVRSTP